MSKAKILIWVLVVWLSNSTMNSISLSKLLYIPASRYSLLNMSHETSQTISHLYDVNVSLILSQVTEQDQTNSIFDYFEASMINYSQFIACYLSQIAHLYTMYIHYEPCQSVCNFSDTKTFKYQTKMTEVNTSFQGNQNYNESIIIDNTFFPCEDGAYQPVLMLSEQINLVISSNMKFEWIVKLVFVLLLQILIILLAYILIMCNKLQKKRDKYIKLKQKSQIKRFLFDSFVKKNSAQLI